VVLTAMTAIRGMLPIAFGQHRELMHHETTICVPPAQRGISLSHAIVFGLAFAMGLTFAVIPSLLTLVIDVTLDKTLKRAASPGDRKVRQQVERGVVGFLSLFIAGRRHRNA
jgi:hypothetical protein